MEGGREGGKVGGNEEGKEEGRDHRGWPGNEQTQDTSMFYNMVFSVRKMSKVKMRNALCCQAWDGVGGYRKCVDVCGFPVKLVPCVGHSCARQTYTCR
jgi:hypothetical protein